MNKADVSSLLHALITLWLHDESISIPLKKQNWQVKVPQQIALSFTAQFVAIMLLFLHSRGTQYYPNA